MAGNCDLLLSASFSNVCQAQRGWKSILLGVNYMLECPAHPQPPTRRKTHRRKTGFYILVTSLSKAWINRCVLYPNEQGQLGKAGRVRELMESDWAALGKSRVGKGGTFKATHLETKTAGQGSVSICISWAVRKVSMCCNSWSVQGLFTENFGYACRVNELYRSAKQGGGTLKPQHKGSKKVVNLRPV